MERTMAQQEQQSADLETMFKSSDGMTKSIVAAHTPFQKTASASGVGANTTWTQPAFFSPLHTPQNWQIPSRRKENYQWALFYSEMEPKVAAAMDFYVDFAMNGFELQIADSKMHRFYERLCEKINILGICREISRSYYVYGDAFPFIGFECSKCGGNGQDPENPGYMCPHENGTIGRVIVLNPFWVEVETNVLCENPVIKMIPDDDLRRIVTTRTPPEIYNKLPLTIRKLVAEGKPIPLSSRSVSHLKHNPTPWVPYGTSLIRRLFTTLAYKSKLMTAQWIIAERLILPIRIVKIGDNDRPAGPEDIDAVKSQLAAVANDPNLTLVTFHAFDYEWVGATGRFHQLGTEFENINQEVLDGLMINQALLNGMMAGYASAAIGVESMIRRIETWRAELKRWIEQKIFLPVAQMKGFIDEEATKEDGEPVWMYPRLKWNDLNMRDQTARLQMLVQLHDKQIVSAQTLAKELDLDYDQEVEQLRFESITVMGEAGSAGGGPLGGGGAMGGMGGGMPAPMGGGGGGAPPMPGMEMGGAPGGAPPGGPEAGGGAPPTAMASSKYVMSPKKREKLMRESHRAQEKAGMTAQERLIQFTSIERAMYRSLMASKIPYSKWAQYQVGPYSMDFALPQIKIGIECDGEKWHSGPEQVERDKRRDEFLASKGWTVVRFGEKDIKNKMPAVKVKYLRSNIHKKSSKES
jgi:very-short-patch-repair endonuclease